MNLTLGGWLTLILGSLVLYGGLFLCLIIALKKGKNPQSEKISD